MRRQVIFLLTIIFLAVSGCNGNKSTIRGRFAKGYSEDKEYIYLTRIEIDRFIVNDSVRIKGGTFKFKIEIEEPTFYQVGFSSEQFVTILASPGEDITITFDTKTPSSKYTVLGSEGSLQVQRLEDKFRSTKQQLDSLLSLYNTEGNNTTDLEVGRQTEIGDEYRRVIEEQRRNNIQFILDNPSSYASILALYQQYDDNSYVLYSSRDIQFMKIVSDSLLSRYPNSKIVQSIVNDLEQGKKNLYSAQLQQLIESLPETDMFIPNLMNVNDKRVSLSSLRGKYVLLSFYSILVQDCIDDNRQLKSIYNTYHTKGFEIYHVNVDPVPSDWKEYVKYEELPWINVREDDSDILEVATFYDVQTVPCNYLIDPQGNIIASNLFGRDLRIKLSQLL